MNIIYLFVIIIFFNYLDLYYFNKINLSTVLVESSTTLFDTSRIDWKIFLLNMLKDVSFFNEVIPDGILLVNVTRNYTNKFLQTIKITNTLIELISKNTKKYHVIGMDQLYRTYRELEISLEEISNSYELSVKIANYLKANYIVYSIFYEKSKKLYLELQLISVKTGEIIYFVNKPIE